jgi:uncharacterized repeat protein (TIGR01451 family)
MKGAFNGTNYLKTRVLADVKNSCEEALKIERHLAGSFNLDTTTFSGEIKYAYPHINLTKSVLKIEKDMIERDGYVVTYRIWIGNDGNQTLEPVSVVDSLPKEETFISSTVKPTVSGQNISWMLQTLPMGETIVIDLKASLPGTSLSAKNRVQAEAKYQNLTIIAEDNSSLYDIEDAEHEKERRLLEETVYGAWAPPLCYNLNSITSRTCERDLDAYYNNLSADEVIT